VVRKLARLRRLERSEEPPPQLTQPAWVGRRLELLEVSALARGHCLREFSERRTQESDVRHKPTGATQPAMTALVSKSCEPFLQLHMRCSVRAMGCCIAAY
jgi:hypothetical protein